MKSLLVATACSLVLACSFTALDANGAAIGEAAPDFTLTDSNGNTHSLADFKGKHVILEWTNFQCPFVKKHYSSGNMQSLQKKYTDQGVVWLTICSSAEGKQGYNSPQSWNQKLAEVKASPTALLIDADGAAGRSYGAKVTPHMFVINAEGLLIYQGAIDSIRSWKPEDIPQAENYVASAVDASLKGEAIATVETNPYGCGVKY